MFADVGPDGIDGVEAVEEDGPEDDGYEERVDGDCGVEEGMCCAQGPEEAVQEGGAAV